ncbi:Methionine ABC transporter ATP-binding protein [Actinokineospora spheciospongiae]|uniref:Methionine ABC transporter ATP-binding protein n=1 Tax=Actinokineospora spheciospongiae TaxID=909613 RepID=W7JES0_9PSEU|nr:ABC transporter ATP-binding protein [Actinokineospora spheciospongiae]EWC64479.1 Methionine ABC transporter ATP-binding protein [Actinokineospora spheciospongiae]
MTPTPALRRSAARTLLRLWPLIRPVRVHMITAVCAAVFATGASLTIPLVLKWMVDGPVSTGDLAGVWAGGAVLLLMGGAEAVLAGLRRWVLARPLARVEASFRALLHARLQRVPMAFHDRWSSGQLLSRVTSDLNQIRMFLSFPLMYLVVNGTTILGGYAILLAQRWTLGMVLLAPVVPLLVLCAVFESRYLVASLRAQDQSGDLATAVEESVLGIRIIKGFGRQRHQIDTLVGLAGRIRDTELDKARQLAVVRAASALLPELALGAALVIGVAQVAGGDLSAGTLVAFLTTALALRWPVESIGSLLAMGNEAAAATQRCFEVLDEPEEGEREPKPTAVTTTRTGPGELVFEGVEFRYPDALAGSPPVLRGVDLRVRAGETVAVVGATGCGKTTLTALVTRMHDPTGGRILLDGVDITDMPRERLRTEVAVAFEEATLFATTVADNVLLGGDGLGEADMWSALEVAQAAAFVAALPQGARTEVGERGSRLSGGQRQRLALSRAIIARPRYLVLDDFLSALDIRTEVLVEAALHDVLADTTALVIAHRPSTVLLADRVALLSGGRIAAVGTHRQLLRENTEYADLMGSGPQLRGGGDDR